MRIVWQSDKGVANTATLLAPHAGQPVLEAPRSPCSLEATAELGDMHPEVSTINAVFGFNDVVPASLDLTRDVTPVTKWMSGISSYSMWWVLIHEDLWRHHGDRGYLAA